MAADTVRSTPRGAAPATIGRDALVEALDRATHRRVTVISAPPGSGKTFLLRAWRERAGNERLIASMSVRRGETDAQRFWLTLLEAIRAVIHRDDVVGSLTPTPEFDGSRIVDRALAELADASEPLVIVVDDLHELESVEALTQFEELLARLPESVHAVLAARRDLRLRLHQLRLEGQLSELRTDDLRFSEGEAQALLEASGIELDAEAIAALHERTEGWAAGLRLAAISLAGHPQPQRFVAAFSGTDRTIADYLLAEMLERQPPDVRQLLLCTSVLERVNGPLADLLTGGAGSQGILEQLEDANAFVVSLDPERIWFRYHHLFGDLLRLELRRTATSGAITELHRRAAGWFAQSGYPVEAIRHAQEADDWGYSARLLVDHALGLTLDGEESTVHSLLERFPAATLEDDPELIVVCAADQIAQGALHEAEEYLALAESKASATSPDRHSRFTVALAVTHLSLARRRGDFTDVMQQVEVLGRPAEIRSAAEVALGSELRALALMNLGIVEIWSLMVGKAHDHLREGAELARRIGRPYLQVGCLAHLGFDGESLPRGRKSCEDAIRLAETHGWEADQVIAPALAALGGSLTFSGEFEQAAGFLDRAERCLRPDVEPATGLLLHLCRGMHEAGTSRPAAAIASFRAAEQMQSLLVTQHALAVQVRSFRVAMHLQLGQVEEAQAAVAGIEAEEAPWGESLTALGAVRLAQGRADETIDALGPVLAGAVPVIHAFTTVQAQMVAARAWVDQGDRRASEAAVEAALDLAERDHLVLPFAMAGGLELLERHPRHATAHGQLLTNILDVLTGDQRSPDWDGAQLTEPLSEPELRVLRYLPSNLTTPELAGELFLSVNTVKTHMRRIYAKLGAHNRSEAVRRARALGLLGRSGR
jgi:LuxR family transcriptional regulator, maltose regulon positive regulatory protein